MILLLDRLNDITLNDLIVELSRLPIGCIYQIKKKVKPTLVER
jgi:hypothetical protein